MERRRNMRADYCRPCGVFCEAGKGWLYVDPKHRRGHGVRRSGWFVKCDACHLGSKTKTTVAMEKRAASQASLPPVPRPWSIAQVKKWTLALVDTEDGTSIRIDTSSGTYFIGHRDSLSSFFTVGAIEMVTIEGRGLSPAAQAHLQPLINDLVRKARTEDTRALEAAVASLKARGIEPGWVSSDREMATYTKGVADLGGHKAAAIEIWIAGRPSGALIQGYDRRTGVSVWKRFTIEEAADLLA